MRRSTSIRRGRWLAICKKIVEQMGGEIRASTWAAVRLSSFELTLPVSDGCRLSHQDTTEAVTPASSQTCRALAGLAGRDNGNNQLVQQACAGFRLKVIAHTARRWICVERHVRCHFMDMRMPEMDGRATRKILRSMAHEPHPDHRTDSKCVRR